MPTEPLPPDPDAAGLIPVPQFPIEQTTDVLGDLGVADQPYLEADDDPPE